MVLVSTTPGVVQELRSRAMGTSIHLLVTDPNGEADQILGRARAMIDRLEAKWSRFRSSSEISRLNAAPPGTRVAVSPETILLVQCGVEAWERTEGLFDPSILRAVEAAGYDRSFDQLTTLVAPAVDPAWQDGVDEPGPPLEPVGSTSPSGLIRPSRCGEIEIDALANTVTLPSECGFDPGGLGKGLAADLVAEAAMSWGAAGVLVNLGGDLRCIGEPPDQGAWAVAVTPPGGRDSVITMAEGAVATSTHLRRRWPTPSGTAHHLIDPATGRPAKAAATVTVLAATGCDAETLATAIGVNGGLPAERAMLGRAVILVTGADGHFSTHGDVDRFVQ